MSPVIALRVARDIIAAFESNPSELEVKLAASLILQAAEEARVTAPAAETACA